jgi:chromosome segregation ATPase
VVIDPGGGSTLGYALQRTVPSEMPSPSTQRDIPSKPKLWGAWPEAPVQSFSAPPVPSAAAVTNVNRGSPSIPARVSCADLTLPSYAEPQPALLPRTAIAGTAEGSAAAGSRVVEVPTTGHRDGSTAEAQTSKTTELSEAREEIRTLKAQLKRLEMCFDSDNVPPLILKQPVAAQSEVVAQLRQARDRISELENYQQTGQMRETELERDNAALRAQLQDREDALQARVASLQQAEARNAELQNAQQAWQQREAQLSQERDTLAKRVIQTQDELLAARQTLNERQPTGTNDVQSALQARDAAVSHLQARDAELQQAKVRISELESARHDVKARAAELTQEKETLARDVQKAQAELHAANEEVARLQGEVDSARVERAAAATAAAAHVAPDTLALRQHISELEREVPQLRHDKELLLQALDGERELASAALKGLREAKRSHQDSEVAHKEQVQKLQQEAEALGEELRTCKETIVSLSTDLITVKGELATARAEASGLDEAHAKLRASQAEIATLKDQRQYAEQRIKNMEAQRTAAERKLENEKAVLFSEKVALQQRLDKLTADMQRPAGSVGYGTNNGVSSGIGATQQAATMGPHSPVRGAIPPLSTPLSPQPNTPAAGAADPHGTVQALLRDLDAKNQRILDLQRQLCELEEERRTWK